MFAEFLLQRVREEFGVWRVACLWVEEKSIYHELPGTDCWPASRDAFKYPGPGPVICHPPCGPWGVLVWKSKESKEHGIKAMEFVDKYGGVVEQPRGSSLFRKYGDWWNQQIQYVEQGDFGHLAIKPTLLYWRKGNG